MPDAKSPKFSDPLNAGAGRFCSMINVGHSAEFFVLDMRSITPESEAILLGRYHLTPGHAKRLMQALGDNIRNFEREHGEIETKPIQPIKRASMN